MCTMIVQTERVEGCGRGRQGWFDVTDAHISYDHPFHARYEHALNIDFVNEAKGLDARVAVELSPASARRLAETILAILEQGAAYEAASPGSHPLAARLVADAMAQAPGATQA